jgi:hypothetical protein
MAPGIRLGDHEDNEWIRDDLEFHSIVVKPDGYESEGVGN